LFAVACSFAYSLPNKKNVTSTEAAHGFIVSSAAEKSASLPQISPSQHRAAAVAFCLLLLQSLGIVEQTLANWVKADKAGQLRGVTSEQVSAERMENIRLRELARVTMERDILGKATAYFAKVQR
jgi:AMMECR1 domain-containing protein